MLLFRAMFLDRLTERTERGEGGDRFRIIRTYLVTIELRDREGQFERVDRIEAQAVAKERFLRLNLCRLNFERERPHNEFRYFRF